MSGGAAASDTWPHQGVFQEKALQEKNEEQYGKKEKSEMGVKRDEQVCRT